MATFEGRLRAEGRKFAIVASKFNDFIVQSLVDGARSTLLQFGVRDEDIDLVRVPGAYEIPPVAHVLAESGRFGAVICLGAVIRGATPHFDYVAGESARGIAAASMASGVPVIYGVLTTETIEQALERAGTKGGNRGADAARAAVEMADLYDQLGKKSSRTRGS